MILAFYKKNTKGITKLFSGSGSIPWLYLSSNYTYKHNLEQKLGERFIHINISKILDEAAEDIRKEHVEWIDQLNTCYGEDIKWWLGSISSRNIYDSSLFQYSCYLEVLQRLSERKNLPELIVLESLGLAKCIKKWASTQNISVNLIHYKKARATFFTKRFHYYLRWLKSISVIFLRWISAYLSKINRRAKDINKPSIVVSTYLHDYCLSPDNIFKDRYFPFLHEFLSKKGKNVAIYPFLYGFKYNYFSIFKNMRKSDTHFLIQEDFLKLRDYIEAFTYPFHVLKQRIEAKAFRNFDLSDLLTEEQKIQPINSGIQALLTYRFFLRLGQSALKPILFIAWYENQVSDKGLIAGVRKSFPKVKIIGAQMFLHPINHLNLFPCKSESKVRMTPDLLLETSDYQCRVAQSFDSSIPCKPAAALRYNHIFEDKANNQSFKGKEQTILVLLPFNIYESVELLEILSQAPPKLNDNIKILIKAHPDYLSEELTKAFGAKKWPQRFEIIKDNLPDALKLATVVISSTSGSIVEAAAKGIPVIFLGRQTVLNQNVLADIKMEIITECFSSEELLNAINKYLSSTQKNDEFIKLGTKLRDTFFTPVTEENLAPFLN